MATLESQDNVKLRGDQTIADVKTFTDSPIVPTPSDSTEAANKDYVDTAISAALPSYISGTAVLNFSSETDYVVMTVLNTLITNTGIKNVTFIPQETLVTSLDDFSLNGVSFSIENIVDNVSFDIRGTSINNASNNYTIKYLIQI